MRIETYEISPNIGEVTFVIISCDVCNNHWDAVVHMETFDSDTQVSALTTPFIGGGSAKNIIIQITRSFLRQADLVTWVQPTLTTTGLPDLKDSRGEKGKPSEKKRII